MYQIMRIAPHGQGGPNDDVLNQRIISIKQERFAVVIGLSNGMEIWAGGENELMVEDAGVDYPLSRWVTHVRADVPTPAADAQAPADGDHAGRQGQAGKGKGDGYAQDKIAKANALADAVADYEAFLPSEAEMRDWASLNEGRASLSHVGADRLRRALAAYLEAPDA